MKQLPTNRLTLLRCIALVLLIQPLSAQTRELSPSKTKPLPFCTLSEMAWKKYKANNHDYNCLTADEKAALPTIDQYTADTKSCYWDRSGMGDSWYDGETFKRVSASSALPRQGSVDYGGTNAHDGSYRNAWVEGAEGDGIGEKLYYTFRENTPRITQVIVANGYVKNEIAWRENGRVKKLKMSVNGKPFAILNLLDERSDQVFTFDPIGKGRDASREGQEWTMTFEILEVYPGSKYEDTVISELHFWGVDMY